MMMAGDGGGTAVREQQQQTAQTASSRLPGRTPKEGERILAATRRPDGTLRKPVRIRAGYVPQDEVAIYQSKGALAALASAVDKGKNLDSEEAGQVDTGRFSASEQVNSTESVESLTSQISVLSVSVELSAVILSLDSQEILNPTGPGPDLHKKIRALKKKIRLATQQKGDRQDLKPEQSEKLAIVEGWREELKLLEEKRAAVVL